MNTFHAVTFRIRYCVDDEVGQGVQCEHRKSGPVTGVIRSNHWSCNPLFAFVIFSCKLCFFAVLLSSGMWFAFSSSIHPSNHFGIHIYALLKAVETLAWAARAIRSRQSKFGRAVLSLAMSQQGDNTSISISIVCSYISDNCGITVFPVRHSNSLARDPR